MYHSAVPIILTRPGYGCRTKFGMTGWWWLSLSKPPKVVGLYLSPKSTHKAVSELNPFASIGHQGVLREEAGGGELE